MDDLSPAEVDALVALVSQPPPTINLETVVQRRLVQEFLRCHEIRPGAEPGTTVTGLYALFREWVARVVPTVETLTPMTFARRLRKLGFQRRFRDQRHGSDRRLLGFNREAGRELRQREQQSPPTAQDRALFDPRKRRTPTK